MNLLHVEVSPKGEHSISRKVSKELVEKLRAANPATEVVHRDLSLRPIPHVNGAMVDAFFTPVDARTPEQAKALRLSDELVDELFKADTIVISSPMWNFSLPSVLKAWIDHIVRAGRTFTFSPEGLKGLVQGKKVYVVVSSGSVFSEGPFAAFDQFTPALKTALGFIGVTDIEIIRVEGTNTPEAATHAVSKARSRIEAFVA